MNFVYFLIGVNYYDLTSIQDFLVGSDLLNSIINKKDILYWFNIWNFINYIFYKWIKTLLINLYCYFIQFLLIIIYNNMFNKYATKFIINFFSLQFFILKIKRFIMLRIIKKTRFFRNYYKFHKIDYLKFLFFIICLIIFFLMWKRRNTYFKRSFIITLAKYYMLTMFLSWMLVPLISNTFIGISLSLLIVFIYIFLKLN